MPSSIDTNQSQFNVNVVKSEAVFEEMKKQGLPPRQIFMTPDVAGNIDNLRTKVLWTNPNPSSDFPSQTITLNSNDYDYLVLLPTHNIANQIKAPACIMPKGTGGRIVSADASSNSTYMPMVMARDVTRVSDTQFTISNCRYNYGSTYTETRNDLLVPYQIIGLYKNPAAIYTGFGLDELLDRFYPVGSIYTSSENVSPASFLSGTWEKFADNITIPLDGTVSAYAAEQYMQTSNTNGSTTCTFYVSAGSGVLNYLKIYNSAGFKGSDSGATLSRAYTTMNLADVSKKLTGIYMWKRIS